MIAKTPAPPYYSVIFTSLSQDNLDGYGDMAKRMLELAKQQPGYLGVESASEALSITVSYWKDLDSIKKWKANTEHLKAQERGKSDWYSDYKTRIAKVEWDYSL